MNHADLVSASNQLANPRVLVLGDLILDRYTTGDAERVSQESPVIVLHVSERDSRLGGAANVCAMLRGLEAEVVVAGVVGDDEAGREAVALLEACGCECPGVSVDASRPTTTKERFVGKAAARHPNQMLRVDSEVRTPLSAEIEQQILTAITEAVGSCDAVIISDYAKGVCTPTLTQAAITAAKLAGVSVLVDPQRGGSYQKYAGATLLKPNRVETEIAVDQKIHTPNDAISAGASLCAKLNIDRAVITLDRDGMALVRRSGEGSIFPISPRPIYDITGAGDMVVAMLGLCIGSGLRDELAVPLANVAAGLEVERPGVAVIPRQEIHEAVLAACQPGASKVVNLDAAAKAAELHRAKSEKVVFTNGCFDLLHVGHVTYLAQAKAMGDILVVGVNSDASVRKLKGPTRPVINETDRAAMLAALAAVDYVLVFDEDTPHTMLHAIKPDVLVKGGTYLPHEVVGHEVVTAYGGEIRLAGVVDGISTTNILASLNDEPAADTDERPPLRKAG